MRHRVNIEQRVTHRNEALERYIYSIASYPILTPDQEEDAFQRYRNGDISQKERIIKANQRFVLSVAKVYSNDPDTVLDLISEGNLGISEAVERFDPTRGFKFISYAVWYIRKYMSMFMRKNALVTDSFSTDVKAAVRRVKKEWYDENGYDIPVDILQERVEAAVGRKINNPQNLMGVYVRSIESYVPEDATYDSSSIAMLTASVNDGHRTLEKDDARATVELLSKRLSDKEKLVIEYSFGINGRNVLSDDEIGAVLDKNRETIRLIRKKSLEKMRKFNNIVGDQK
jgi:RNA polymerase primary sigma factor